MMEKLILALLLWIPPTSSNHVGRALSPLKSHRMIHVRQLLPIGQRVDGFLPVDKPARYYFAVNGSHNSMTIRVTPCESPLFWTLSFQPLHERMIHLATEFADSDGYYTGHMNSHQHLDTQKLFSFQGNGEESFSSTEASGGFYLLDLFSLESDTNFQLFIWDNKNQVGPLPQLPTDPRVDVVSVEEDKVDILWKPSVGATVDNSEFEYCVFVNKQYNFKTLCATKLNTKNQPWPHWNGQVAKSRKAMYVKMETQKNKAQSSPNVFKTHSIDWNIKNDLWSPKNIVGGQRICVGHWVNATISGLKPKTLYYFDVFAINSKDGTSIAYTGTFAETKAKHKISVQHLHNEEMVNVFLKSKGLKILNMDMPARGFNWLFIHSCLHKVLLQIIANGNIVVSQSLQGAHNFKLIGNTNDNYIITLKSSRGGPGLVKLFTTTSQHRLPFPNLSPDINLSVSNKSCSSVTLSWAGNGEGTKYCIYARHLEQNLDLKLIHKHQNSCLNTNTRSRAEKVICRQGGPQTLTEEQIRDLKPGKAYLLDLYITGTHNSTIKFPSHVVRTQESCS